jgi:hypothetical protein
MHSDFDINTTQFEFIHDVYGEKLSDAAAFL